MRDSSEQVYRSIPADEYQDEAHKVLGEADNESEAEQQLRALNKVRDKDEIQFEADDGSEEIEGSAVSEPEGDPEFLIVWDSERGTYWVTAPSHYDSSNQEIIEGVETAKEAQQKRETLLPDSPTESAQGRGGSSRVHSTTRNSDGLRSKSCPECGSSDIEHDKKGFSGGKAAAGGIAAGPVGALAAGSHGSDDVQGLCTECGHTWKVGGWKANVKRRARQRGGSSTGADSGGSEDVAQVVMTAAVGFTFVSFIAGEFEMGIWLFIGGLIVSFLIILGG